MLFLLIQQTDLYWEIKKGYLSEPYFNIMKPIGHVFGSIKPQERTKGADEHKKYKQLITNIAKTQITEQNPLKSFIKKAIKIIRSYLNSIYYYFILYLH